MTWALRKGRFGLDTLWYRFDEGTLRLSDPVEAVHERFARRAVSSIQSHADPATGLQGWPRVAGSAA